MVPGPLAITIGQQVVPVSDKHARGCGLPGRFRSGSKRGSGYRAPWMVTEVPADLSRESCSVAFVQPVLIVGHESSVCEDEYMRVGVDPAKMFGRKAGGSGYVVDVDQPRHRRVPGCGHANDTAAVRPAHRSNWRRAGSYGVADFGGILDKSGHRSAVGGQIWPDYLYVCILQRATHPAPVVWISPQTVSEYGTAMEPAGPGRHLMTVSPNDGKGRLARPAQLDPPASGRAT